MIIQINSARIMRNYEQFSWMKNSSTPKSEPQAAATYRATYRPTDNNFHLIERYISICPLYVRYFQSARCLGRGRMLRNARMIGSAGTRDGLCGMLQVPREGVGEALLTRLSKVWAYVSLSVINSTDPGNQQRELEHCYGCLTSTRLHLHRHLPSSGAA